MGIFDDAIRQHLDLKRRLGAEETELKQLEDEAFGPPARPGDPEFGDTGEQAAAEAPVEAAPEEADPKDAPGPAPEIESLESELEALEPEAAADAGESEPEAASTFTTAEREAIAEQPTTFFDQQTPDSAPPLELDDLDLDLEEELEEVGALEEEPAAPPDSPVPEPEPTVEAEIIEEADELEEPAASQPVEESAAEGWSVEEPEAEPLPPESVAEEDEDAEDVLEETPEFLRDNPDDDELWFEQGKPKDFDF